MINIDEKFNCSGCHSCLSICPKSCISMKEDHEGFLYPKINNEECIDCGLCEKHCPILCKPKTNDTFKFYAAYSLDKSIRLQSSSGGLFTVFASHILKNNGIVYGAAFNKENEVVHMRINNIQDLNELRGSKYVQSKIGSTFEFVKKDLLNNKVVYFSGTPCQIDGLKAYLNREYDNLICQDIICHGVPSPYIWRKYLNKYLKLENNISINFRSKDNGWYNYNFKIITPNETICESHHNNLYMKTFLNNYSLRPSCYSCHSKTISRSSDITLGDFWGVENFPDIPNDNTGISLLIIHSNKGVNLLNLCKSEIYLNEVDYKKAIKYNPSIETSSILPSNRKEFFSVVRKKSLGYSYYRSNKFDAFCTIKFNIKKFFKGCIKHSS